MDIKEVVTEFYKEARKHYQNRNPYYWRGLFEKYDNIYEVTVELIRKGTELGYIKDTSKSKIIDVLCEYTNKLTKNEFKMILDNELPYTKDLGLEKSMLRYMTKGERIESNYEIFHNTVDIVQNINDTLILRQYVQTPDTGEYINDMPILIGTGYQSVVLVNNNFSLGNKIYHKVVEHYVNQYLRKLTPSIKKIQADYKLHKSVSQFNKLFSSITDVVKTRVHKSYVEENENQITKCYDYDDVLNEKLLSGLATNCVDIYGEWDSVDIIANCSLFTIMHNGHITIKFEKEQRKVYVSVLDYDDEYDKVNNSNLDKLSVDDLY